MRSPRRALVDWFVGRLTSRRRRYQRFVYNVPENLKATIRPGDVLLVDGDQRISQAIKYLTMSSWSHSALYIGDALLRRDPATRAEIQRRFGREAKSPDRRGARRQGRRRLAARQVHRPQHPHLPADRPEAGGPRDRPRLRDLAHRLEVRPAELLGPDALPPALPDDSGEPARGRAPLRKRRARPRRSAPRCSPRRSARCGSRSCRCPVRQKPRNAGERIRQQILGRPTRRAYSGLLRARHPTLCVPARLRPVAVLRDREVQRPRRRGVRLPAARVGGREALGAPGSGRE